MSSAADAAPPSQSFIERLRARTPDNAEWRYLARLAVVAGLYVAAAKFGIDLSVAHGVITPVWAPTGISLAALVIFGPRTWPAVALGAFISNATSDVSVAVAAVISVGNTLEAVAGAYLVRRAGMRRSLERVRDVLVLVVLAAVVSTTISATNGVTTLWIAGHVPGGSFGSEWALWWTGDAMGDLLVAPVLLVLSAQVLRRPRRRVLVEAVALALALVGTSMVVFVAGQWRYPYLLFPVLIWAALRFRQLGATTAMFVASAIAVWGTVEGWVPIGGATPTQDVQILQALLSVVAISLLLLGATLTERQAAEKALQRAHASLAEAQEIAHVGSWQWEIAADRVSWSDELYRIYGLAPQSVPMTYEGFLERVHPDDRERVRRRIERAYADRQRFDLVHRIVLPDGSVRTSQSRGDVVVGADGEPARMVGTAQDITERQLLDNLRNDILSAVSHELRTPLASILGFSLTLRHKGAELDEPTVKEILDHLNRQATKLDQLLSDLLDVDRLGRGLAQLNRRPTDVAGLVEQVVASQPWDDHSVQLELAHVVVEVDAPKVERIVENLLANALKYTPAGTCIVARVAPDPAGVLISVEDDGPGIPDDLKESVFDVFKRGADTGSTPGVGIGLALVSQFANLHGGRAWVEDNGAGGASFRVLLAAAPQPATQGGSPADQKAEALGA
jgi:PAS domain S-box-containing protein